MPDFDSLRRYVRLPWRSAALIRREVDEELANHIAMRADALRREGLSADDARASAIAEFGDVADASQYCSALDERAERRRRRVDWLGDVTGDLLHGVRLMRRSPTFTLATTGTLAVAIAMSMVTYGVLHAYLIRPLPFPEPDRIASVIPGPSLDPFPRAPSLQNVDWNTVDSLFDATAAWDLDGFTVPNADRPDYIDGAWVSAGFFRTLGLRPAAGRAFRAEEYRDHAPVALISHEFWTRRFGGDSSAVGTVIAAHSTDRPREPSMVTVVGILPKGFWHVNRFVDLLRPLPEPRMPSLARIKTGQSMRDAQGRLNAVVRTQIVAVEPTWHMTLMPLAAEHAGAARPILLTVSGAALFMLLAACASVAGTLVSRMASRRGELAIRAALGGATSRILRQLLTEGVALAAVAAVLGIAVAYLTLGAIGPMVERQLGTTIPGGSTELRPALGLMVVAVAITVGVSLLFGFVPSLILLWRDRTSMTGSLVSAGRSAGPTSLGSARRSMIIGTQIAFSMVLLFGAGLMVRTIGEMGRVELGFRPAGVLKADVLLPFTRYPDSTARRLVMDRVLVELRRLDGVSDAASVFPYPFRPGAPSDVTAEGTVSSMGTAPARGVAHTISDGYFTTVGVGLIRGRAIEPTDDARAPLVVVIGESLARRLWPDDEPLGKRIRIGAESEPWRTVVGVTGDTRHSYSGELTADLYLPYAQNPRAYQALVVRSSGDLASLGEAMRRGVAAVDPVLALSDVEPLADIVARDSSQRRGLTTLLALFSLFALGLAVFGLNASLGYMVAQRRTELAMRIAVGADTRAILGLVVGEGLRTTLFGILAGGALCLALGGVLQNQLFGVSRGDPTTFVAIAVVLMLAALAASAAPAVRAARTDPAAALRG